MEAKILYVVLCRYGSCDADMRIFDSAEKAISFGRVLAAKCFDPEYTEEDQVEGCLLYLFDEGMEGEIAVFKTTLNDDSI